METYEWIWFLTIFGKVITHNPFAGCSKETTYGYGYLDYFEVALLPRERTDGVGPLDPSSRFYMEFYVRASQNAHILLAALNGGTEGLEILLGGGSNTFCQIRQLKNQGKKSLATLGMRKVVSATEDRGFWIEIDSLNNILVGKRGVSEPFLHYHSTVAVTVEYVSFSTWTNTKGVWHFGCSKNPPLGVDDEERNVTAAERLRSDLFAYYNPANFPQVDRNPSQIVQVHLEANGLYLDEEHGELEISGIATVKWDDWMLKWNPQDYDTLEKIYVSPYRLWTPKIKVLNSATFERTNFLRKRGSVSIKNNGEVNWRTPFLCKTFCSVGYTKWPYDVHNCTLVIGFSTEPLKVSIDTMTLLTTVISKWEIQNPEENDTLSYIDDEHEGVVQFHLQRSNPSAIIRHFIVPPFLSAATLILLSFWMNPNSSVKLFLCCGSVFIVIVTLTILGDTLSKALTSERAGFYYMTAFYCFPVLLFVGLRYLPDSIDPPPFISKFLNSRVNGILFCLPSTQQLKPGKFSTRDEIQHLKNAFLLGIFYERLIFFIYLTCFVISFTVALALNKVIL